MKIENAKRIVIKVGSSLLINTKKGDIRSKWLDSFAKDIANLKALNKDVIVVSSGSVAIGRKSIHSAGQNLKLEEKQAAAACGQYQLVRRYQQSLKSQNIEAAQILITLFDSENRRNYLNIKNTIEVLLKNSIVPIINENDTVATQELRYGDNDRLAARVAQMTGSDLLILLSDIDGLYSSNPKLYPDAKHIKIVERITPKIVAMGGRALSSVGSGGMATKIEAAKIATDNGCHTIIAKGEEANPIKRLFEGGKSTWFMSNETPLNARKSWIAANLSISGEVVIDKGALKALENGKSLLPAGVIDIVGDFERGDIILIKDHNLNVMGKGIVAYSSSDAKLIIGHQSSEIKLITGFEGRDELIHRDDMAFEPEDTIINDAFAQNH